MARDPLELERQNPHWEEGFLYPYPLKRELFNVATSYLGKAIVAIFGMRRVGKTTLVRQMINHLIEKGVERERILYFSFDDYRGDFWEVVRAYENIVGERVGEAHYLFFDEIQKVDNWAGKVKLLYDTSRPNIVVTGSAVAPLRKGSESLAGRLVELTLEPLSFQEFLLFRGKAHLPTSPLEGALEREYALYLRRQLPELVDEDKPYIVESLVRKVIFEDIPTTFPVEDVEALFHLWQLIRDMPGQVRDYTSLAEEVGVSRPTVANYLRYLSHTYLVRVLYNYSPRPSLGRKKAKKLHPYAPFLSSFAGAKGDVLEGAVAFHLKARYFWRHKDWEVDVVVEQPLTAVEVKAGGVKGLRGLGAFRKRYGGDCLIVAPNITEGPCPIFPPHRLPFHPLAKARAQGKM